jgi:hypothetical protein
MAILVEEHKDLTRQLTVAQGREPPDVEAIRALQGSLEALRKEIAFVGRQPVYEDHGLSGINRVAAKPAPRSNPRADTSAMTFEGWDVFRNFGKVGSNAKSPE